MWISSPARSRTYRSAGSSPKRPSLPIPTRVRIPDTADGAIPSVSAISGPVNRNRLRAAIASTRRSQVRFATNLGAEGRSKRPASPSTRNRPTHLRAHRTLTSAAAAASVTVRLSTTTRRQSSRLLFRLRAALACNFIRCPPWDWWRQTPPASKGARMNQPPQELHLATLHAAAGAGRRDAEQPADRALVEHTAGGDRRRHLEGVLRRRGADRAARAHPAAAGFDGRERVAVERPGGARRGRARALDRVEQAVG